MTGILKPLAVTCDFEKGLHNAVRFMFPGVRVNGCLFHWKQAICKHMKAVRIKKLHIEMMMTPNVLDILTVIPRNEIYSKGIPYVKSIINPVILDNDDDSRVKMGVFWKYFKRFWCSDDKFIATWNINDPQNEEHLELVNRTNNALERYNRTLNEMFSTPHPTVLNFVRTLEEESRRVVKYVENVALGHEIAPEHKPCTYGSIPLIYKNFTVIVVEQV